VDGGPGSVAGSWAASVPGAAGEGSRPRRRAPWATPASRPAS